MLTLRPQLESLTQTELTALMLAFWEISPYGGTHDQNGNVRPALRAALSLLFATVAEHRRRRGNEEINDLRLVDASTWSDEEVIEGIAAMRTMLASVGEPTCSGNAFAPMRAMLIYLEDLEQIRQGKTPAGDFN